jgi:hypothetical protein
MLWTDQHILLLAVLPIETCIFPRPLALDWELYHNMCTFSISSTLHRYDLLADVYFYLNLSVPTLLDLVAFRRVP